MWLGWTCWASFTSVISVSAFCSVGALATVSFLSLLTSLVTARARGSLSHLPRHSRCSEATNLMAWCSAKARTEELISRLNAAMEGC